LYDYFQFRSATSKLFECYKYILLLLILLDKRSF